VLRKAKGLTSGRFSLASIPSCEILHFATCHGSRSFLPLSHDGQSAHLNFGLKLTGIDRGHGSSPEPSVLQSSAVICERPPVGLHDIWGQRWEVLERYLEERVPCLYLMLDDWLCNLIAPRVPRNVQVIGLVRSGSKAGIGQAARHGEDRGRGKGLRPEA